MVYIGIDIGSTSAKTVVMDERKDILLHFCEPTGWSSFDAADRIMDRLRQEETAGVIQTSSGRVCVSTGYGREAVTFADRKVTEITCHARGAAYLFGSGALNIIDIGGQDTKVISVRNGRVEEFFMNDKCAAGTGKFIEVMAGRLQVPIARMDRLAGAHTQEVSISSMCTVFAESEMVSLAGQGVSRENLSYGVLSSISARVSQLYAKLRDQARPVCLTGGLSRMEYLRELLGDKIQSDIKTDELAMYAGAIGAALSAPHAK